MIRYWTYVLGHPDKLPLPTLLFPSLLEAKREASIAFRHHYIYNGELKGYRIFWRRLENEDGLWFILEPRDRSKWVMCQIYPLMVEAKEFNDIVNEAEASFSYK